LWSWALTTNHSIRLSAETLESSKRPSTDKRWPCHRAFSVSDTSHLHSRPSFALLENSSSIDIANGTDGKPQCLTVQLGPGFVDPLSPSRPFTGDVHLLAGPKDSKGQYWDVEVRLEMLINSIFRVCMQMHTFYALTLEMSAGCQPLAAVDGRSTTRWVCIRQSKVCTWLSILGCIHGGCMFGWSGRLKQPLQLGCFIKASNRPLQFLVSLQAKNFIQVPFFNFFVFCQFCLGCSWLCALILKVYPYIPNPPSLSNTPSTKTPQPQP
jgi:hypothetical protein